MKNRKQVYVQTLLCTVLLATGTITTTAMAADAPQPQKSSQVTPPPPAPTKEQREKMAKVHEKVAVCLRSDRAVSDCHQEAMKVCQEAGNTCMMHADHMRHGMGGGPMDGHSHGPMQPGMPMNSAPNTPPSDKK